MRTPPLGHDQPRHRGAAVTGVWLATDRLVLRDVEDGDLASIHACASDPEVCRYSPWGPNSLDETRAFVADCLRDKEVVPRTRHTLAVTLEDAVIGAVTVVEGPDAVAELGYVMNRSFWGAGFATEAASRALRWAFDDLRASSVFATCRPNNAASIRVLEKTGMRRDALLVDHMWMRDHWEDSYRFVLP